MRKLGFTLIETLVAVSVVGILAILVSTAAWSAYQNSSLAISANNIRQLNAGSLQYLADHKYQYWKFRVEETNGTTFWFGFESTASMGSAEGEREFDPKLGPLGDYVPASVRPDPSLKLSGKALKPKYKTGYLGVGYNGVLGGGFTTNTPLRYWDLKAPEQTVVFATSAQINTIQRPATAKNPMIEDFYLIDENEITVHFRHHGMAMVGFANGAAGFLPIDESTRDSRAPKANIGRFAPKKSKKYLE